MNNDWMTAAFPLGILVLMLASLGAWTIVQSFLKPHKEEEEDEFTRKKRELAELRARYEAAVKEHPEDEELLTQIFLDTQQQIIESEPPPKPKRISEL